jgi:tetratricopeptide (TPR) repeat protein
VAVDNQMRAREALRLVQIDPRRAAELAQESVSLAIDQGDPASRSIAERALGLAAVHVQDLDVATAHLRTAIRHARRAGSDELVAEARMTMAFALNRRGQPRRALAEIDAAVHDLGAIEQARAIAQRAAILQQVGRLDDALLGYRAALPALRRGEDIEWIQRVLLNRGVLHAFRRNYSAALRDLHAAERLCAQFGLQLPAAFVQENLGFVYSRLGDVPVALKHLVAAEQRYASLGAPVGSVLVERSELLLSVLLVSEARDAAVQAVGEFERTRRHLSIPEARLLLARTADLDGDFPVALREARRAVAEFTRQGRREWVVLARFAVLVASLHAEGRARVTVRQLDEVAIEASLMGWTAAAADARLLAGQLALARRRTTEGRRQLEQVSRSRHHGVAALRARAWYATALLRHDAGDRVAATAAVAVGLRILDDYRATMAATDLRAGVSGLRRDLVQLGLRNAMTSGSPHRVLVWAELGKSRYEQQRPVQPPNDPTMTLRLAELRSIVQDIRDCQANGRVAGSLIHKQIGLERAIRDLSRQQRGELGAVSHRCPPRLELADSLGEAALVEYVELDETLHAITLVSGRLRLHALGPVTPLRDLVYRLPFALRRLAGQWTTTASGVAAAALLRDTARRFDTALLRPLAKELGERPLVLVPTGLLQSMPWALLPSTAGRPVTVAPSVALWHGVRRRAPRGGSTVVVAGPDLPSARREAVEVAALHGAEPLLGPSATVEAVTAALDGAGLAHLAAHGQVRADNPLFSSLRLADGPLTVYDLERLQSGPDTVVLAACESARSVVLAGEELLGLSAAFLCRDTRQLVGSVVPIPDAETEQLMIRFHMLLASGTSPAPALASAQENIDHDNPASLACAAGFVSVGAGFNSTS